MFVWDAGGDCSAPAPGRSVGRVFIVVEPHADATISAYKRIRLTRMMSTTEWLSVRQASAPTWNPLSDKRADDRAYCTDRRRLRWFRGDVRTQLQCVWQFVSSSSWRSIGQTRRGAWTIDSRQQTALWRRLVPRVYTLPSSAQVAMDSTSMTRPCYRRSLAPATRHLANTKANSCSVLMCKTDCKTSTKREHVWLALTLERQTNIFFSLRITV